MFTPPARQDSGSGNTPGLISMVVDEALHEGFGPAKHTTYRLTTTLKKTSTTSTCRKRFSHFIALRAAMVEAKPGLVIPPLPEKSVMNRFESDFVEDRRLMLEVFLNLYAYTYLRLDGSTKPDQRQIMMTKFNTDEKIFSFILSTRSGGVGIKASARASLPSWCFHAQQAKGQQFMCCLWEGMLIHF